MPNPVRRRPDTTDAGFRRADAALLVLLALVGTWLGHNAVYLTANRGGLAQLVTPVHFYMVPVGAVLLAIAALGGVGWARALGRLRTRLTALQQTLRGRRPGRGPVAVDGSRATAARRVDLLSVWMTLSALQLVLYVAQENLEARAVHAPLRGVAVVLGAHWLAIPVHVVLALALAAAAVGGRRRTVRLQQAVRMCGRLVARLLRRRRGLQGAVPRTATVRTSTPLQRWGASLWQRPPPFVAA